MHGCNSLPDNRKRNFSLTVSIGYQKLLIMRKEAQKEAQMIRAQRMRARVCEEALQLLLPMSDGSQWAFRVLRSPNPGWELFVELDELVITRVVEFLQENGWDGSLKRIRRDADITEEVGEIEASKDDELCTDESQTSKDDELCTDEISLTTSYELGLLQEIICHHMYSLNHTDFNFEVGLIDPKPAS